VGRLFSGKSVTRVTKHNHNHNNNNNSEGRGRNNQCEHATKADAVDVDEPTTTPTALDTAAEPATTLGVEAETAVGKEATATAPLKTIILAEERGIKKWRTLNHHQLTADIRRKYGFVADYTKTLYHRLASPCHCKCSILHEYANHTTNNHFISLVHFLYYQPDCADQSIKQ